MQTGEPLRSSGGCTPVTVSNWLVVLSAGRACRKQQTPVLTSTEAEYMGLSDATKELKSQFILQSFVHYFLLHGMVVQVGVMSWWWSHVGRVWSLDTTQHMIL